MTPDQPAAPPGDRVRTDRSGDARLVGVRVPYADAPAPVRAWAEATLGAPLVEVLPRIGGMSPAVAASLRGADGRSIFVKAVGAGINPDTPSHFRHEIAVLAALPPAPYRAGLLATYDDGDWVGIALDDVSGRHPDWDSARDRADVLSCVQQQTRELTPVPAGLPPASSHGGVAKYLDTMANATPNEVGGLPDWAAAELPTLVDLVAKSLDHHRDDSFCHWDIRYDNILFRHEDGQPMLLDWGMSRRGQRWGDTVIHGLEWVAEPAFDEIVATLDPRADEEADITGFIAGVGCYLLMTATHPPPPGLPNIPAFRRQVGADCLRGVRRRLDG